MRSEVLAWRIKDAENIRALTDYCQELFFRLCWQNSVSVKSSVKKRDMMIGDLERDFYGLPDGARRGRLVDRRRGELARLKLDD